MSKKKNDGAAVAEPEAPQAPPEPGTNGNGNGANDRKPMKVFSFQVGENSYIQASIWGREGTRRDGQTFSTFDVTVRKRYRNQRDEWASAYSYAPSELYVVIHAMTKASEYITELRATNDIPF